MLAEIKLYLLLGAAAVLATGSFAMGYRWEAHALDRYKAHVLQANAAATLRAQIKQRQFDNIALEQAQKEAASQAALAAHTQRQLAEVRKHVAKGADRRCITYGLVRVLDAAAGGILGDTLSLPTGKSDDACAPVDWPDLAASVAGNYGTCRQNSDQLDTLIGTVRRFQAARP